MSVLLLVSFEERAKATNRLQESGGQYWILKYSISRKKEVKKEKNERKCLKLKQLENKHFKTLNRFSSLNMCCNPVLFCSLVNFLHGSLFIFIYNLQGKN